MSTDNTATSTQEAKDVKVPNPLTVLVNYLTGEIERLEAKGKKPKTLIAVLGALEPMKEANNIRVQAVKEIKKIIKAKIQESLAANKDVPKNILETNELFNKLANVNATNLNRLALELSEQIKENQALRDENTELHKAIDAEPKKNLFNIRRPASALLSGVEGDHDTVGVNCDPKDVLTRIFPIIHPVDGCMGFAVVFNSEVRHYFYFTRFAQELEISRGQVLDIDGNKDDALLVYQVTLQAAIAIADTFASILGGSTHVTYEGEVLESAEVSSDSVGASGDSDSEDDEDETEGDSGNSDNEGSSPTSSDESDEDDEEE